MRRLDSPWIFISLLAILAIDSMSFGLVLPILPKLIGTAQGITITTDYLTLVRGCVVAVFPLMTILGTSSLGYASDNFGRKRILSLSLFGSSIGLGITGLAVLAHSLLWLLLGRAITGFLSASYSLAQATVIDIAPPTQKALMLAWVAIAMTIGMLAGPLVGGLLDQPWAPLGLALPFMIAAGIAFCNTLLLQGVLPETHRPERTFAQNQWKHSIRLLCTPQILPKLIAFTLLEFTWSWYFQGMAIIVAPISHWTPGHTAWVLASLGILMSLGLCLIFPLWLKFTSLRVIRIISLCSITLSWVLSLLGHTPFLHALTTSLITINVGIAYTALLTELSEAGGYYHRGWLMGVAASLLALAWALSGFGLGLLNQYEITSWVIIGLSTGLFALIPYRIGFSREPVKSQ